MWRLGRYVLFEELSPSGHARWFLGFEDVRSRSFAPVDVLLFPSPAREAEQHQELLDGELGLALRLMHRRIGMWRDAGRAEGWLYLVRDHHAGVALAEVFTASEVQRRPLHPAAALHVVRDVLRGLASAHLMAGPDGERRGVVHGALDAEQVRVRLTGESDVLGHGTRALQPTRPPDEEETFPTAERDRDLPPTMASDVHAAARLAFEALAGRRMVPKAPSSLDLLATAVGKKSRPTLDEVCPNLPLVLANDIERALDVDPAVRFPSAVELERALHAHLQQTWPGTDENLVRRELQELLPQEEDAQLSRLQRMAEAAPGLSQHHLPTLEPPPDAPTTSLRASPFTGHALSTRSGAPVTFRDAAPVVESRRSRELVVVTSAGLVALAWLLLRWCGL
ncbi:MAG: hypothetical protein AB2A00_08295 [Myxococcota bacterium]